MVCPPFLEDYSVVPYHHVSFDFSPFTQKKKRGTVVPYCWDSLLESDEDMKKCITFSYGGIPTKWDIHGRVFFMWSFTSGSESKLTWWFKIRVKLVLFSPFLVGGWPAKVWWIDWTQQPCWKRKEREEEGEGEVYQKGKRKRRSKTKEKEKTSPKKKAAPLCHNRSGTQDPKAKSTSFMKIITSMITVSSLPLSLWLFLLYLFIFSWLVFSFFLLLVIVCTRIHHLGFVQIPCRWYIYTFVNEMCCA